MKVWIDADGCPVIKQAVSICKQFNAPCTIVCDTAHEFNDNYAQVVTVDKGADSSDYAIINMAAMGDIVLTQDYGLAAMCMAKNIHAIHQDGWKYTSDNIDALLMQRHTARKLRSSGTHMKGPRKRTHNQDESFILCFKELIQQLVHG